MNQLRDWSNVLRAWLAQRLRSDVYYVTDRGRWSFYWDAYYITHGLRQRHGIGAHIIHDAHRLRKQIIQIGDRYAYLRGGYEKIHPSNVVFLTWFHGDINDPNPDIQEMFACLPAALPHLQKIVITCRISHDVLTSQGVPPEKLVKIPLGVDLKHFQPPTPEIRAHVRQKLGIPAEAFCIGSFQKDGRGWEGEGLVPKLVKGPDIFLETMAGLARRHPNLMVLLTGPARGYVKQGLEKIGVPYVHQEFEYYPDILPCYHALDLYLITSRSEGGPKALLESWATAVPLVSTRVGMCADLMRHGVNGLITDVEDVTGLIACAEQFISDADLRDRCVEQALKDVAAYDWGLVADGYFELYKSFL